MVGNGFFSSGVGVFRRPREDMPLFQYNGPYQFSRIWLTEFCDIVGDSADEIFLVKTVADTVLFEILSLKDGKVDDTIIIPAAIGTGLKRGGEWHDILVHPLLGVDLNGDGQKELIYSRSAKPDSAFARGIVAYDIRSDRELWIYETADNLGMQAFHMQALEDGSVIFLAAIGSANNRYAANGMDSWHSYAVAFDGDCRTLWRRCLGKGFFNPAVQFYDVNGDGIMEMLTEEKEIMTEDKGCPIFKPILLDSKTGDIIAQSKAYAGCSFSLKRYPSNRKSRKPDFITVTYQDRLVILSPELTIRREGELPIGSVAFIEDLNGDGDPEIVAGLAMEKIVVLDTAFNLLASIPLTGQVEAIYEGEQVHIFIDHGHRYSILAMSKRGFRELVFAKYKWWLAVLAAMVLVFLLYRLVRWITGLYLSSSGLLTLEKINALVIVLNRKGIVIFANDNKLKNRLLGEESLRWRSYRRTALVKYPAIIDEIDRSFIDPYQPLQTQLEIADVDNSFRLEVVIYPRLGRQNHFDGKVIIMEDVTGRQVWERKVVLGEAAQRWVHRLKGNMATIRLHVDNMREDSRLRITTDNQRLFYHYLDSIHYQVAETAETANKILRFSRISKPQRLPVTINAIVDTVLTRITCPVDKSIVVEKRLQDNIPPALLDADQMTEVIENLVLNACEAIPDSGTVVVYGQMARDLQGNIHDDILEIVVEDNGCGITEEYLTRIFEPGFSKSGRGTGIGLAIVKEIVSNHGGTINVISRFGEGSRFIIRLPMERRAHE